MSWVPGESERRDCYVARWIRELEMVLVARLVRLALAPVSDLNLSDEVAMAG
jgi:hypothetical protein